MPSITSIAKRNKHLIRLILVLSLMNVNNLVTPKKMKTHIKYLGASLYVPSLTDKIAKTENAKTKVEAIDPKINKIILFVESDNAKRFSCFLAMH